MFCFKFTLMYFVKLGFNKCNLYIYYNSLKTNHITFFLMKNLVLFRLLVALVVVPLACTSSQNEPDHLHAFHLSEVTLTGGPFLHASNLNIEYVLAHNPDRLLAPFLIDAGLEPKAPRYGNWESGGLDGHTAGHMLSALAMIVASTGNERASEMLEYMIEELARCQKANGNGYVGGIPGGREMWNEIASGTINAQSFSLNGRWVPWYNIHKLYAGLRDAWLYTENRVALEILIGLSDWAVELVQNLSDEQIQQMLISEHGGMNEIFADVYAITKDDRYAKLADQFSHRAILDPLLQSEDQLTGLHANTQIPKVIGFKRVAEICPKPDWENASTFFWKNVVQSRTVAIGGNSVAEHFHPTDDFSSMMESREGPETCNTYNMMRLAMQLYLTSKDLTFIDYYERALYNHILSSQHPEHGGLVYFTPMRPGHYRVYSNPEHTFWCCVGTGIENHARYGELVYAHDQQNLYVNLFMPTQLDWKERGITVHQHTGFPESETSNLTFQMETEQVFGLYIRHPQWLEEGKLHVEVNGEAINTTSSPGSYFKIHRTWRNGDEININMPMHTYGEYLPDGSPYMALLHGPIVLAAAIGTDHTDGLVSDDSRMGQVAAGLLYPRSAMPMLVIEDDTWTQKLERIPGQPLAFHVSDLAYPADEFNNLTLIPFYNLHDQRYMIYWQIGTLEEVRTMREELAEKEESIMDLERQTIARVTPGQQQPESEHNFSGEKTESGVLLNRHWRQAEGWFTYDMSDPQKEARVLRLIYYAGDTGWHFHIYVNGHHLAEVRLDEPESDRFIERSFALPVWVIEGREGGQHTIRFEAVAGYTTSKITDVRLLK